MPLNLNAETLQQRCSWCGKIIKGKPIVVKTCCNNKPWVFCSDSCYRQWHADWLRKQEQKIGKLRKNLI
ncbi:MAG: TRASH domain-containing protein [Sulfolobaceae archaeon]|nr:TRASH domain-containing protein [Sulfolobaceae archaeon]